MRSTVTTRLAAAAVIATAITGVAHADEAAPAAPPAAAATTADQVPASSSTSTPPPAAAAPAAAATPPGPTAMTTPAMAGPLTANSNPLNFNLGPLGDVYVTGVVSGLGLLQSNHFSTDHEFVPSLSNGQVFIQKPDGVFQYFVQIGAYTLPSLGTPYFNTGRYTASGDFFGPVPQAFVKIAPTDSFSIMAGKLPTLIGAEYTFTFENMNIERGLLWNQENAVNRGVQANYTVGPVALSVSLNDGFYSNRFSWLSGSATWTIDPINTLAVVAGGNLGGTGTPTLVTPIQNNGSVYNIIYTYNNAPWTITPYFQATHVSAMPSAGAFHDAATYGGAVLANYSFPSTSRLSGVSLPARVEYIVSTGNSAEGAANLLYGPGSSAFSITFTPTYQFDKYFVRGEVSFVQAFHTTPGLAFNTSGVANTQTRGLLEFGAIF